MLKLTASVSALRMPHCDRYLPAEILTFGTITLFYYPNHS